MKVQDRIVLFKSKESREPKSFELCPRFEKCQINRCPLHPDFLKLKNDSSDPSQFHKEKCIPKRIRFDIGISYNLQNKGLKIRELSNYQILIKGKTEKNAKSNDLQARLELQEVENANN